MATYKITLSAPSWTQTTAALYWDTVSQRFYTDTELTDAVTAIVPPTRECYRFSGFYDGPAGDATVQYINSDGSFTADFFAKAQTLTGALTITGLGTLVSLKVSFNQNGGTSEPFTLYYRVVGRGIYADSLCEGEQVTSVPKAVAVNKAFCGYYSSKTVDGEKYVTKDGGLTIALKDGNFTGDLTIYAVYQAPVKVTVSANGGTGGAASFYCDLVNDLWYATADVAAPPITSIALHAKECYRFVGCWSTNAMTGKMLVSPDGTISADWRLTANVTIYAQWEQVSYKVTIGKQSGTGGTDALYYSNGVANPNGWYKDDLCVEAVTSIALPSRAGFAPKGVFSATANGTQYISPDGTLLDAFAAWGNEPTFDKLVNLIAGTKTANSYRPTMRFVGNANVWSKLAKIRDYEVLTDGASASPKNVSAIGGSTRLLDVVTNKVIGRDFLEANLMPDGKLLFGDFSQLAVCLWSGTDIIVDPYANDTNGGLRLVALQDSDILIKRTESFALATGVHS